MTTPLLEEECEDREETSWNYWAALGLPVPRRGCWLAQGHWNPEARPWGTKVRTTVQGLYVATINSPGARPRLSTALTWQLNEAFLGGF